MRIALTRPEGHNEALAELLRAAGHEVVVCPLIATEPLGDEPVELDGYDWLVVTSVNGARELIRRGRGRARRTAAIGPRTAAELPYPVDLVPRTSTQEGLLAELPRPAGRVLLAAAEGARRLLVDELAADFLPLYRTRELQPDAFPDADLVVLASGSGARALSALRTDLPVVTIGPLTTRAARESGLRIHREAETPNVQGLLAACSSPS
jgi:uroporphyrinogen III methyltransferase/synthase